MRQIENYSVWIGNAGDLRDPRAVLSTGAQAVVELADNEQLAVLPRDLIRLRFPISDSGENQPSLLRIAINSVAALIREKIPALVCCSGGLNRSICIVAAALALCEGRSYHDSLIAVTQKGPVDISPGFSNQIYEVLKCTH
jgi:protein-tyrosine phosphatase